MKMRRISLDELVPGMRVVEPVLNTQSVLLLKAGTELSVQSIRTLKTWGVASVFVEGSEIGEGSTDHSRPSEAVLRVEAALADRFSRCADDPVMVEIRRVAANEILKRAR